MIPKIGYSILDLRKFSKKEFLFDTYELRASSIRPNIKKIIELKEKFSEEDLSMHSGLSRIFSCVKKGYPEFSESEMEILKYEIMISKIIGISRINFHMTNYELEKSDIEKFKELIAFAKENGVELIYENHVCSARAILYILENFPEINICLDLGHLNIAIFQDAFGMDLDSFIEKAKNRVVHIHIHNNDGRSDSHCGINNGIFKWEDVLSNLPNVEKVILEVRDFKEAIESREILREFYSN